MEVGAEGEGVKGWANVRIGCLIAQSRVTGVHLVLFKPQPHFMEREFPAHGAG